MRWFGVIAIAFVIAMALALALKDQIAFARIATAYAAKQTCSCLHAGGRSLQSCRTDYNAKDIARIAITPAGETVRASVLGGAISSKARHTHGFGCSILP